MESLEEVAGTYRTAPRSISWFARTFPSVTFHSKFMVIVLRSAVSAMRGKYDDQRWALSSLRVMRALESVGVEFEIDGLENLRKPDGPCLVIGNHMSTLETTVLPGLIEPQRRVTFVVKQQLLEYPVFKHVMRSRDPIAVTQTNPRADLKAMLAGGLERLKQGVSLVVFPQGERTQAFNPSRFNTIGVKLAARANVPIVPLALETSAWGLGKFVVELGQIDPSRKVHFTFGAPISVENRGLKEHAEVIEFIRGNLSRWTAATAEAQQVCTTR